MCFILNKCVCSDLCQVKDCIHNILIQLQKNIDDDTVLFDAKLILNELVTNGVIHGNHQNKTKSIKVRLELSEKELKIEVTDEGIGFCYKKNEYNPMELKCSGRGLVLVDGLSDEFYIEKNKAVSIKYV